MATHAGMRGGAGDQAIPGTALKMKIFWEGYAERRASKLGLVRIGTAEDTDCVNFLSASQSLAWWKEAIFGHADMSEPQKVLNLPTMAAISERNELCIHCTIEGYESAFNSHHKDFAVRGGTTKCEMWCFNCDRHAPRQMATQFDWDTELRDPKPLTLTLDLHSEALAVAGQCLLRLTACNEKNLLTDVVAQGGEHMKQFSKYGALKSVYTHVLCRAVLLRSKAKAFFLEYRPGEATPSTYPQPLWLRQRGGWTRAPIGRENPAQDPQDEGVDTENDESDPSPLTPRLLTRADAVGWSAYFTGCLTGRALPEYDGPAGAAEDRVTPESEASVWTAFRSVLAPLADDEIESLPDSATEGRAFLIPTALVPAGHVDPAPACVRPYNRPGQHHVQCGPFLPDDMATVRSFNGTGIGMHEMAPLHYGGTLGPNGYYYSYTCDVCGTHKMREPYGCNGCSVTMCEPCNHRYANTFTKLVIKHITSLNNSHSVTDEMELMSIPDIDTPTCEIVDLSELSKELPRVSQEIADESVELTAVMHCSVCDDPITHCFVCESCRHAVCSDCISMDLVCDACPYRHGCTSERTSTMPTTEGIALYRCNYTRGASGQYDDADYYATIDLDGRRLGSLRLKEHILDTRDSCNGVINDEAPLACAQILHNMTPHDPPHYEDVTGLVGVETNKFGVGYVMPPTDAEPRAGVHIHEDSENGVETRPSAVKTKHREEMLRLITDRETAFPGSLRNALDEGLIRPQYHIMQPIGDSAQLYVAASHKLNAFAAIKLRHFKQRKPRSVLGEQILISLHETFNALVLYDLTGSGVAYHMAEKLKSDPASYKSNKWSSERFVRAMSTTAIAMSHNTVPKMLLDRGLPRTMSIKKNEALSKMKPRLLIATGDKGTLTHIFDAGFFEHAFFALRKNEERSTKHVDGIGRCIRIARLLRKYRLGFAASMDFSAFDGSIDSFIRSLIENKCLPALVAAFLSESPVASAAAADRCKAQGFLYFEESIRAWIEDMIRESGDRGTTIMNYLKNKYAHMCVRVLEDMYRAGLISDAVLNREEDYPYRLHVDQDSRGKREIKRTKIGQHLAPKIVAPISEAYEAEKAPLVSLKGKPQSQFRSIVSKIAKHTYDPDASDNSCDIIEEGDDGLQFATEKYVQAGRSDFGSRWCKWYEHLGFSIEPQGPSGALEDYNNAFNPAGERVEFCSVIYVGYNRTKGCKRLPKPIKTLTNALVSFAVNECHHDAGYTKSLSAAENCIDCEILFQYFMMLARYHREEGGIFKEDVLDAYDRERIRGENEGTLSARYETYGNHVENGRVEVAVAFHQETGMTPEQQSAKSALFATTGPAAAMSVSISFLASLGIIDKEMLLHSGPRVGPESHA